MSRLRQNNKVMKLQMDIFLESHKLARCSDDIVLENYQVTESKTFLLTLVLGVKCLLSVYSDVSIHENTPYYDCVPFFSIKL